MKKQLKNRNNIIFLIVLTIIVLYFSLKDNFFEIIKIFKNISLVWIVVFLMIMGLYFIIRTLALYIFVKKQKNNYKFSQAFKMMIEIQFFNAITPFSSGGQAYEIYSLNKAELPMVKAANISIQTFISYQIALIVAGLIAFILNQQYKFLANVGILSNIIIIGFMVNVIVIITLFLIAFSKKFDNFVFKYILKLLFKIRIVKNKDKTEQEWRQKIDKFNLGASDLFKHKIIFFTAILINLLGLIILYSIPYFVSQALNIQTNMNIIEAVTAGALVMLISSSVPLPGGTGGLEYGYIELFGNFFKGSFLNASMLLWRFVTYYFGAIIGLIVFSFKGDKK